MSLRLQYYSDEELGVFSLTEDIPFSHAGYFFSLTENTEVTEVLSAQFRAHRTPPAYRVHRALLPKMAVRFCEIGWLNVSVGLCVFCSSVIFREKKNNCETRWGGFSFMLVTFFSHRAHGGHGGFKRTVSSPQNASGIQSSQRPHPQPLSEWRGE